MSYNDWAHEREQEARARRHEEIKQREHLASLTPDQRAELRRVEDEVDRAAQTESDATERRRRTQQRTEMIVAVWERLQGHRLTPERRSDFVSRPEVQGLLAFSSATLARAGRKVMDENDGELRLAVWIAGAPAAWEEIKAEADALPPREKEPNDSWRLRPISKLY